jgi:RNA polymerase sigma-70 factor (ECF subfamily)
MASARSLAGSRELAGDELLVAGIRKADPVSTLRRDGEGSHKRVDASLSALLDEYARGPGSRFDELYRRGGPRVRRLLMRLGADPALADDLTQETFLRIHRARGSFVPGAAAMPWMFAIARNAFRDHLRRETVRSAHGAETGLGRDRRGLAPADTLGDEALAARELASVVKETLASLPLEQREAFILVRFEGLSVSEVSAVVGASESSVKTRAFRAYEALRAALMRAGLDIHAGPGGEVGGAHRR